MSITKGQQLKSSSNSKTFTVSCFWKEITCSDDDQEDSTESGIPAKTHSRKPGTQCGQLARGCRWAAGLRGLLLCGCTLLSVCTQAGKQAHRATAAYGAAVFFPPSTDSQPAFWVRAGIHVYTEMGGSLLLDHVLTGVVCYWGSRYTTYSHSFHSFLRNTEAILGIDLCFWVSEKIEKSKEKMLFRLRQYLLF